MKLTVKSLKELRGLGTLTKDNLKVHIQYFTDNGLCFSYGELCAYRQEIQKCCKVLCCEQEMDEFFQDYLNKRNSLKIRD